jgi:diacylglycerol kinase (ATP)
MSAAIHAIVNPRAGGGRTGRKWPELRAALTARLGPVEASFTQHAGHASELTAAALRGGARLILAVGGDGTINECVNGFFDGEQPVAPEAALGLVTSGTGGDLRRSFGIGDGPEAAIERLAAGAVRRIDLGRMTFTGHDGALATRWFANIASFGLSGAVDQAVNRARIAKWFGGSFAFAWCSFTTLLSYRGTPVRLSVDDGFDETVCPSTVAVCNGAYFGGGMNVAPDADPSDGLFHVVVMTDEGPWAALRNAGTIYTGKHVELPSVRVLTGRRIAAAPLAAETPVLLDIDGEAPGRLPADFRIVPGAIAVRC